MSQLAALLSLSIVSAIAFADDIKIDPKNNIHAKGLLTVTIPRIKEKKGKWDLDVQIKNENDEKGIIIFLSDLICKRGTVTGSLKHTFFNTGERTMDFRPGQMKDFHLVCKTEGHPVGPYQLTIAKVYSNPSLDGKTVGKIIARDLKWKYSDKGDTDSDENEKTQKSDGL